MWASSSRKLKYVLNVVLGMERRAYHISDTNHAKIIPMVDLHAKPSVIFPD